MSAAMMNEPTVYAVDDDAAVLKSLRWLIGSAGLQVKTFSSGASFLEGYDAKRPGCLILDMRMPGMNGLELQTHLLERGIRLPVIFMTGHADVPACTESFRSRAFDFIEKPANDEYLLRRIAEAITQDTERLQEIEDEIDRMNRLNGVGMAPISEGTSLAGDGGS
jgi:two-component system, LuxR family, response regulator FixJ